MLGNSQSFTIFYSLNGESLGGEWYCSLEKLKEKLADLQKEGCKVDKVWLNKNKHKDTLIYDHCGWLD